MLLSPQVWWEINGGVEIEEVRRIEAKSSITGCKPGRMKEKSFVGIQACRDAPTSVMN